MSLIDIDAELWAFSQDAAIVVANAHKRLDAELDVIDRVRLRYWTNSIRWPDTNLIKRDAPWAMLRDTLASTEELIKIYTSIADEELAARNLMVRLAIANASHE